MSIFSDTKTTADNTLKTIRENSDKLKSISKSINNSDLQIKSLLSKETLTPEDKELLTKLQKNILEKSVDLKILMDKVNLQGVSNGVSSIKNAVGNLGLNKLVKDLTEISNLVKDFQTNLVVFGLDNIEDKINSSNVAQIQSKLDSYGVQEIYKRINSLNVNVVIKNLKNIGLTDLVDAFNSLGIYEMVVNFNNLGLNDLAKKLSAIDVENLTSGLE